MLHSDRRRAESFGADAQRYDRSRPGYPDALIDAVVGPDPAGRRVLEVGCGTGIASRLLTARGVDLLAVEVDGRMAELARARGITVEVSAFEAWEPAGRTFEVVTAAQAWHWVDPVGGAAKAARLLDPGGRLAVFWNVGHPDDDVAAAMGEVYDRLAPDAHSYSVMAGYARGSAYQDEADGIRACELLGEPRFEEFPWSRRYGRDEWLDQLPTHSDHAAMDPELRARVLAGVGDVIDSFGGSFEMHYRVVLLQAERRAAAVP